MTLSGSLVIARRAAIRKTDGPARHANERHGNLAAFVRQMRDQGMTATLVGSAGIATQEFATIAGESAEGTFMTYGSDRLKRPEAQKVAQRFKAKSFDAEVWTLYSYASVQVLKQAAEAAQSLEPHTIAAAIHSGMSLKTAIGDLSFDKRGMQGKNLRS